MDETREIDIDLRKIFYKMRNKVIYILLFTILLGAAAGCFTQFFIDPIYSATVKMFVYSNTDRVSSDTSISQNDINASKDLIGTYMYVLESDTVLKKVAEDLGLNTTPSAIRSLLSTSMIEDTQAFQVTVKCDDPKLSAKIANSIAKIAPDEIIRVVKAGGVEIIDYATVPNSPSSPDLKKNILVGTLAGFVISFLAIFVYELFDSTITNAKDLEREFEIPVLGTIPKLEAVSDDNKPVNNVTNPLDAINKPSSQLLENIQSMKGDSKND